MRTNNVAQNPVPSAVRAESMAFWSESRLVARIRPPGAPAMPERNREMGCLAARLRLNSPTSTEPPQMSHNFAINDDVHHQLQGPQGRAGIKQRSIYTIVTCLPIEADGRPRYRIKSKTENVERVVTEEQISRLG